MAKSSGLLVLGGLAAAVGVAVAMKSASQSTAASSCGPLDANLDPALAKQINMLFAQPAGVVPASTFAALAQTAQAAGYPLAAACLNKKAASASSGGGTGGVQPGGAGFRASGGFANPSLGGIPAITDQQKAALLQGLAQGLTGQQATQAAGISPAQKTLIEAIAPGVTSQQSPISQQTRQALAQALTSSSQPSGLGNFLGSLQQISPIQQLAYGACQHEQLPDPLNSQVDAVLNGGLVPITQAMLASVQNYPRTVACLQAKKQLNDAAVMTNIEFQKAFMDGGGYNTGSSTPFACDTGPVPNVLQSDIGYLMSLDARKDLAATRHAAGFEAIANILDGVGLNQIASCLRAKSQFNQQLAAFG